VFTVEERDRLRERLLALAAEDDLVVGAAITGSHAVGTSDEWSDVDLAFSIRGDVEPALERWTDRLQRDFGALHHWDLRLRGTVYRVFLLPDWLEVDIAFTPEAEFGARGAKWRTVFGETVELAHTGPQPRHELIGVAWHHVLHARACIERGKPWEAEWLIGNIREHVLALACLRLGYETRYARGADLLPQERTAPLEATLVRSLDEAELPRALAAAAGLFADELERTDASLAAALKPMLLEFQPTDEFRRAWRS
jgi:predicted nucleotidyltransferase